MRAWSRLSRPTVTTTAELPRRGTGMANITTVLLRSLTGLFGGHRSSRELQDLRALFRRGAREHAQVAGVVGFDDRDRIERRIGFDQVVQRIPDVQRVERRRLFGEDVGGRLSAQSRRIHQVAIEVPLERAHFHVGDARDHAEHDQRDEERQPGAQGHVPKPFRPSGANVQTHWPSAQSGRHRVTHCGQGLYPIVVQSRRRARPLMVLQCPVHSRRRGPS